MEGKPPSGTTVEQDLVMAKPWWQEPFGMPPSLVRRRERRLKPWETNLMRVYLVAFPLLVLIVAIRGRIYGMLTSVLIPLMQWHVTPDHQRRQILGRDRHNP